MSAATTPAPRKQRRPLFVLVCLYRDDITAVFASKNLARAHEVRDKLRAAYGSVAAFHTIQLGRQSRWQMWEGDIRAQLGLADAAQQEAAP